MATTKLTRTPASSGTGARKKMTWSWWVKRSKLGATQYLYNQYNSSDQYNSGILFQNDDKFRYWDYGSSGNDLNLITNRKFRDTSAWYHIVLAIDTTQGTSSNRVKLYVNGVQETSFSTETYPNQDHQIRMNEAQVQQIGFQGYGSTYQSYFDGSMSHINFVDGLQLDASAFGSTDNTTGEWQITTAPSVTYGTNGFFILKDSNSVTDQSGNSNNFTVGGGTLTKTEDCPSNVFATLNALINTTTYNGDKLSNGNNTASSSTNYKGTIWSTLGASTGKYYWEAKAGDGGNAFGIVNDQINNNVWSLGSTGNYVIWNNNGNIERPSGSTASGTTFALNDIIGVAWNATDGEITFYKNGTAINSGTAYSVSGTQGTMFASVSDTSTGGNPTAHFNFGNGYFGTTAVSSAGTNASGNGIFEYDVPNGFTALSTKGLNL